ncbi:unnamed protein product [Caenorhabditis sp. 36 PRJEB53466]|nr:unnamed protein product [Caenorhabditis sp. 36 PRJEB53466]
MCRGSSRHIFYFPWRVSLTMLQQVERIVESINTSAECASHIIPHAGRHLFRSYNALYKAMNLVDLYEGWKGIADENPGPEISFSRNDIETLTWCPEHQTFIDMFRLDNILVGSHFNNAHEMLDLDEVFVQIVRSVTPSLAESEEEEDSEVANFFPEPQSHVFHFSVPLSNWQVESELERRNILRSRVDSTFRDNSLHNSSPSFSRRSSISSIGDDFDEVHNYVSLENGHFDEFEDLMQIYSHVTFVSDTMPRPTFTVNSRVSSEISLFQQMNLDESSAE